MNPIKSTEELFVEALESGNMSPGRAFPVLVHSAEYGEAIALLMLEDEKRLAELAELQKFAVEWRFGYFVVDGVPLVLLMLSIGKTQAMLGSNVREIWINHRDPRQGPEASLLRRLAAGCPVILRLYDSHAQVVKSIHIDVPPLLHHFAKTALTEVPLLGSWSPDRFNDGKLRLQNRFDLEALWGRVLVQQMAIFSDQGELLPIVCDSAPE